MLALCFLALLNCTTRPSSSFRCFHASGFCSLTSSVPFNSPRPHSLVQHLRVTDKVLPIVVLQDRVFPYPIDLMSSLYWPIYFPGNLKQTRLIPTKHPPSVSIVRLIHLIFSYFFFMFSKYFVREHDLNNLCKLLLVIYAFSPPFFSHG